jgi:glycosyltransferase involved in cell wall biosynthesis
MRRRDGVLVVGRALHPPWNEGTRVLAREVARLAAGVRPTVAVSVTAPEFLDAGDPDVAVRHVGARGGYGIASDYGTLPALARAVVRAARTERIAVAHLVGAPAALAPLLRANAVRVVTHVTLTNHVYQSRLERLRAAAARRVYGRLVDAYACAAEPLRRDLADAGYPESALHVVPPPLDLDVFRPVPRAEARAALGMDQDAFSVVYVGTISPARFPAPAVGRALDRLAEGGRPVSLDVFAPVRTHPYNARYAREHVHGALQRDGVTVRVRLQDLAQAEKPLAYSAADVVVVPFTAAVAIEPPLTLVEAMACGAAVAVAGPANRSRIVADGETGAAYGEPDELAGALTRLAELGAVGRDALGRRARDQVVAQFGPAACLRSLESIWTSLDA